MRKLLAIVLFACLISCATTKPYDSNEFTNENYQKNIDNLIINTDSLKDFSDNANDDAKINVNDIGLLVQADLYFNQGDYANALPFYEKLAYKYKIPKIIYKTIICYERSGLAKSKVADVNNLMNLFIKTAPNTNIAKLLEVKQDLYAGDLTRAEKVFTGLIKNDPDNARNYLLFLSATININSTQNTNNKNLDTFASYILDNYTRYPECYLLASTLYATTNNTLELSKTLNVVKKNFPDWQIPLFWSVNILSANGNYKSIIIITEPYVVDNPDPDLSTQNIYVGALLNDYQSNKALTYLQSQSKLNDDANIELNMGIIYAVTKNYNNAVVHLIKGRNSNLAMSNIVNMLIALIYDTQKNYVEAVKYYEQISGNVYMENIAHVMSINDYSKLHDNAKIATLLTQIAKDKNLTGMSEILFKAQNYINLGDYDSAYNLLSKNYKTYKKDKDYVYMYASTLAVSNRTREAINTYKYYIKLDPKSAFGYNDLAYVYAQQTHDYKSALTYAKKAAAIDITDYNILDTLGWVYYKMGDYTTAYPLINSSYKIAQTEDAAKHLKAVLIALNQPKLADKIIIVNQNVVNAEVTKMMLNKVLGILMLLQYGSVNPSIY